MMMEGFVDSEIIERDFMDMVRDGNDERFYKCKMCGKLFTRNYSLKVHILSHLNIKRFECQICFKRFNSKQYLNDHLNIHSGDRPYVCPFEGCGLTFKQRAKLSVHRKTVHNDVAKRTRRVLPQPTLRKQETEKAEEVVPVDTMSDMVAKFRFPEFFKNAQLVYPAQLRDQLQSQQANLPFLYH
mmetsp:Transcript_39940/g.45590  ORF Transcript_39940/g.45590 Transcript_39940/m.45590 type:complete len:184 (+) Transcript_39940:91-642(+)